MAGANKHSTKYAASDLPFVHACTTMFCVDDQAHFMAWAGLLISLVGYLTPFAGGKDWWIQLLLSLETSMLLYAVLAAASDAWTFNFLQMTGTMLGVALMLLLLVRTCLSQLVVGIALLLTMPFVVHQIMVLTTWLQLHVAASLPSWSGIVLFALVVLAVLVVGWLFRLVQVVRWAMYVVGSSINLFVFLELAVIEASQATTQVCCDWSSGDTVTAVDPATGLEQTYRPTRDNSMCPLDVGNAHRVMTLVGILLFAGFQAAYHLERQRAAMRRKYGSTATRGSKRGHYDKLRESPEPEPLSEQPYDVSGGDF